MPKTKMNKPLIALFLSERRAFNNRWTDELIAKMFGVDETTIRRWIRKAEKGEK